MGAYIFAWRPKHVDPHGNITLRRQEKTRHVGRVKTDSLTLSNLYHNAVHRTSKIYRLNDLPGPVSAILAIFNPLLLPVLMMPEASWARAAGALCLNLYGIRVSNVRTW
jgi:hypothetical protein